ncbi:MAG: HlyD family type I secretion periplasmic adaptor subunit [Gemmatimonas sp.]
MTLKSIPSDHRVPARVTNHVLSMRDVSQAMNISRIVFVGLVIVTVFFVGFVGWASVAPIDSAAVAPATIVVESSKKAIQHFDGGTVSKVLVHEGDQVVAGQTLVIMDDTSARANVDMLRSDLDASLALQARLLAERDRRDTIAFPEELTKRADAGDVGVQAIVNSQQRAFIAKRDAIESQIKILDQRNAQIDEEVKGLRNQIASQDQQLKLIKEEQKGVEELLAKGLERKPRLLQLQRNVAEIEGTRAQNYAAIARAQQTAGENELKKVDLTVSNVTDAAQKLHDEQVKIGELREKLRSAQEVLDRTTVRAPTDGQIVNLKLFTPGGVLPPRDTVMEIVPQKDQLVAEAQVAPTDIDVVHADLPVQLRLTALNQRVTPTVFGHVQTVSADRQQDQRTGNAYYTARIVIDRGLDELNDAKLYPGMPAEAMIVTGERTLMSYLFKPLLSGLNRGLRED